MFIDYERLSDSVQRHEGLRLKPYKCTAGKQSIGYGRNLSDRGITKVEAKAMLDADLQSCMFELMALDAFRTIESPLRREIIIEMCFNLGLKRLLKFQKMWAAILCEAWQVAAEEMLDSKWAKQVGNRAITLAKGMKDGD